MCAYCLLEELFAGGPENFELDHFRPQSLFPSEISNYYNIYYSCHPCNRIKHGKWPSPALQERGIGLVDLCADDFPTHFQELEDGQWIGLTPSGRYTIDLLRLNRRHLVDLRNRIRLQQLCSIPIAGSFLDRFPFPSGSDRRGRMRMRLALPVVLCQSGETDRIETHTEDVSSDGFYCVSDRAFSPGDQ